MSFYGLIYKMSPDGSCIKYSPLYNDTTPSLGRFVQHPKNFGLIASYLERKVNETVNIAHINQTLFY